MRIALVSDSYWPRVNGVSVSIQSFRDAFVELGHDARIYCPFYPESYGVSPEEPTVRRLPSRPSRVSPEDRLLRIGAIPAFFRELDAFAPDVIHINTEFTMSLAARLYARTRGYPLVVTSHTDYEDYANKYFRFPMPGFLRRVVRFMMCQYFKPADFLVTPSPSMRRKLHGYGIPAPIRVIPTGVPGLFARPPIARVESYRASLEIGRAHV